MPGTARLPYSRAAATIPFSLISLSPRCPCGARGAILAAIIAVAMSNASGSLNSLAASSVVDFQQLRGLRELEERSRAPAAPFAVDDSGLGNRARRPRHGALGADARSGIDDCRHHSRKPARTFPADVPFRASDGCRSSHGHVRGARGNSLRALSNAAVWTWYVPLSAGMTFLTGALVSLIRGPDLVASETR